MTQRWLLVPMLVCAGATAEAAELHLVGRHCTKPDCYGGIPSREYQYRPRSPSQTAISRIGILLRTRTVVADALEPSPAPVRAEYRDEEVFQYHPGTNQTLTERIISRTTQTPVPMPSGPQPAGEQSLDRLPGLQPEAEPHALPPTAAYADGPGEQRRVFSDTQTVQPPRPEPRRQTVIDLYQLDQARLEIDQCEISQVALQLHDDGQWVLSLRADQNRRPDDPAMAEYNPRLHIQRNQFTIRLRCLGAFKNEPAAGALAAGKPVLVELDPKPFWVENGEPRYVRTGGGSPLVANHFADIDRVEVEFFYR